MKVLTREEELEIIRLYTEENRGQLYCAKKAVGLANVNYTKNVLKKYGIPIRNQSQAAILSNKNREKKKNKDYFKVQSPNMAWLMGFIAADGTIRKNSNEIKIGLNIKDKEILEKIRQELELETTVKEYTTNQGYECCTLAWTCEQHKIDLAEYNIIPQKTFKLQPPSNLNKEYHIDYVRGYFDGDGSVNLLQGGKALRWQVCSATKEIIQFVIDTLEDKGVAPINILEQKKKHILYYCQYSTLATKQIYGILYTPNSLFLKRKKDHFKEILFKK